MSDIINIKSALISVWHKEGLDEIVKQLAKLNVTIYSTGGTKDYIEKIGVGVNSVEDYTKFPAILGGRVKTLHPKIFGGILARRENSGDVRQTKEHNIQMIDLVIVDLYPFEKTVKAGASEDEIIEKIDIGGISLIRAAAKNFKDVLIISSQDQYSELYDILTNKNGQTGIEERKEFAKKAFDNSSSYDSAIYNYFDNYQFSVFKQNISKRSKLRYGENPHQNGLFFGDFDDIFEKLNGKEISYNNLLDIDAAVNLISEFNEPCFAILKHNNACGISTCDNLLSAWQNALAADPLSAFGGVLITNKFIDIDSASEIDKLFFEVIIAKGYDPGVLDIFNQKKNRIILIQKDAQFDKMQFKTVLNGVLFQDKDNRTEDISDMKSVTKNAPDSREFEDLVFANKIVKHSKSNAIVLVKNKKMIGSGIGQTSRVDALKQAILKAKNFGFDLKGSVMASDAFFPFADSVEIAHKSGISAIIQPGGSVRDKDSIEYCNNNNISMVFTGVRHFKH
ncbi:MAG: bifunctional phosphoribosylaminoimidazolecarboxamide formyltransferase/IMP cyclohydrolase [Bacteroidota bacterium]